jgi:hypothetical protein
VKAYHVAAPRSQTLPVWQFRHAGAEDTAAELTSSKLLNNIPIMERIRRHRALIAWIALVALLGNLAAGMLCSPQLKPDNSDLPRELLATMVICTSHGEQLPGDDTAPPPSPPCQICVAVVAVTLILLVAALLGRLPPARPRWFAIHLVLAVPGILRRDGLGSRAPPLPA